MASEPRPTAQSYSAQERAAIYRAIDERRDMRHFAGGSVAPEVLQRLLTAAHHAPSVGFMQPSRVRQFQPFFPIFSRPAPIKSST